VGNYIRDYEHVRLLFKRALSVQQISSLAGLLPNVVEAYAELVFQFHPDLKPNPPHRPLDAGDICHYPSFSQKPDF
jgi:hypothetical protein